jgi:ketosteroid isomerase-like protein
VDEIWNIFRKDVEAAGTTNGLIRTTHPGGSGLVTQSRGYGFVFEKRADGQWHCLQDEKK